MLRLMNAGFGNMVCLDKVVAFFSPNSAPSKRLKDEARDSGRLIDFTQGRRTRSFILTTANQIILSAVQVETLAARFQQESTTTVAIKNLEVDNK